MDFFRRLSAVDLLHLEDLGAEKQTDWVLEQLYSLINERYEDERSIVATTNLGYDELERQIGARTASRLIEICGELLAAVRRRSAHRDYDPARRRARADRRRSGSRRSALSRLAGYGASRLSR